MKAFSKTSLHLLSEPMSSICAWAESTCASDNLSHWLHLQNHDGENLPACHPLRLTKDPLSSLYDHVLLPYQAARMSKCVPSTTTCLHSTYSLVQDIVAEISHVDITTLDSSRGNTREAVDVKLLGKHCGVTGLLEA